jgi:cation:H+ antiporter
MKPVLLALLTGHGPLLPVATLCAAGAAIFLVARRLARHADTVAVMTGLGGVWVGSVLLAGSTSLPELLTSVNAAWLNAPDIGVADLLGASLANMLILAVLDLAYARRRILHQVAAEHALLGLLGVVLITIAGLAILVRGWGAIGHVGVESWVIGVAYVSGMRLVYRSLAAAAAPAPPAALERRATLRQAFRGVALATAGLALVTPLLVVAAEALALEAGLSVTFVGAVLVGVATSFPELAATVSAVRLGALDLAVGNVFGSVAFNMFVLLVLDAAYLPGPVLGTVRPDHVVTALVAIGCVALGAMGILSRAQRRPGPAVIESALIIAGYALGAWLLQRLGGS